MSVDTPVRPSPTTAPAEVVGQLARVETRRLLTHPATLAGVALAALHTWALLLNAAGLVLPRESVVLQSAALTLGAAVLVAAHLTVTRTRRDDVGELLAPARHGTDAFTRALLVAVAGPTVLSAVLVTVALAGFAAVGAIGQPDLAEATTAPAVVAFAGTLGVLLGRIAPWRGTPLVAVVALGVLHIVLAQPVDAGPRASQLFVPVVLPRGVLFDVAGTVRPATTHLLYLLALTAVLGAAAALVGRRSPLRVGALVLASAAMVASGMAQLRPVDDDTAQRLVAAVATPEAVSDCIDSNSGATVCALPPYQPWGAQWAAVVDAVRQPAAAAGVELPPLTVVQRADNFAVQHSLFRGVDDEAAIDEVMGPMAATPDRFSDVLDDRIAMTHEWPAGGGRHAAGRLALGLQVARAVLDLPASVEVAVEDPTGSTETSLYCDASGQAREVIAVWLAAQTGPAAEHELRRQLPSPSLGPPPGGLEVPAVVPAPGIEDQQLVAWQPAGTIAVALLERPEGEVMAALAQDWDRWAAPTTTVRELVDALDLDIDVDELPAPAPLLEPGPDGRIVTTQQGLDQLTDHGATGCP